MIKQIDSFEGYTEFIAEVSDDRRYSDPHFSFDPDNLYSPLRKPNHFAFAVIRDSMVRGVFVWLINEDERYTEMIVGLVKETVAVTEMLAYLEAIYPGFQADFVINPKHAAMLEALASRRAHFDTEQLRMRHTGVIPVISDAHVEEYTSKWRDAYCRLHREDTYWTAEKVLSASDRFRVLLAFEEQRLVGYLDVTCCFEENEPYDLYVKPEAAHKGCEQALLAAALKRNAPKRMSVPVDVDSSDEIRIYRDVGFEPLDGQNSRYATYRF